MSRTQLSDDFSQTVEVRVHSGPGLRYEVRCEIGRGMRRH
jgi:hypothetical protein